MPGAALLLSMLLSVPLAGCAAASQPASSVAGSAVSDQSLHNQSPKPTVPTTTSTTPSATASVSSTTRPATATRVGETVLAAGVVLPNRRLTPGAVSPAVTQANIHQTICLTGYTKTVRPASTYTTALKRQQLAAGYTYRGDLSTSDYEEDHLISLELGGSPASVKNLWPEPYAATEGARVKDKVENRLHDLVCSGRLSLRAAQYAIAANWWTAYVRYGGSGVPTAYDGSYSTTSGSTSGSTTTTSSSSTSTATAQCRDGSYSYSKHRSGTCSHHGGVARWINPPQS